MVYEPYVLAVVLGLLISAAIYFVLMWPQIEPEDPPDTEPPEIGAEPSDRLSSSP